MHTFLSRGSGQASARQYVQATSGKGLRPAGQPQRGDEAAVRIDGARRVLATLRALDCAVGLAERGDARPTDFVRARARQDQGQLDLSVGFGTLREVSYTVTALVVSVRSLRAPRPPTAADWTRRDELGVGPDAIAGKSLKRCKREVADASELSIGRERSRPSPLLSAKIRSTRPPARRAS